MFFDCIGRKLQVRGKWIPLQREPVATNIRRIYVSEDVVLPPMQQTPVNARVSPGKLINRPWTKKLENGQMEEFRQFLYDGVLESDRIKNKPHVYSARCVIPAQTVKVKVPLFNIKRESQMILRETKLGEVHIVEKIREIDRVENNLVSDMTPRRLRC